MGYGIRDGDIISTDNEKFGALVHSVPVTNYDGSGFSPAAMWAGQPQIRTVVDFITNSIALVPFDVYERTPDGGRRKARGHAVQEALKAPGFRMGQRRWVQQLQHDMLLYGRWAFTTYPREDGGLEFIIIPAHMFSIAVDGLGRYTDLVLYLGDGRKVTRPLTDVTFDLNVQVWKAGTRTGSTPVSTLDGLARESAALNEYRSELFRNSAMVPAVIERPTEAGKWSDEAWGRFRKQFSTYRPGGGSAGGVPILEDGMTYKPVDTVNPRDLEYVQVRQLTLMEAAQALHIPPELVGAKDGTHSNIVALREQLYVDVLGADIGFFEDALNAGLRDHLGPDHYVEANIDARLRATFTERVKAYQSAGGGPWLTRAEIRARENLEFLEGTDELIVPMNVTEGGLASPNDTGQTNEEGGEPYKAGRMVVRPKALELMPARTATVVARQKFENDVAVKGEQLREDWLKRLGVTGEKAQRGAKVAYGDSIAKVVGGEIKLPTIDPEDVVFDVTAMTKWTYPRMQQVMATASKDQLKELGVANWENWSTSTQENWCYRASQNWSEHLILTQYRDVVNQAVADDPATWRETLLETLGEKSKLTNAAQTIGTELESVGRNDAARAAGATTKTWRTTSKAPRPSHATLNGQTVPIDGYFLNGLRWPGDHSGRGPETANCRCVLVYGGVPEQDTE